MNKSNNRKNKGRIAIAMLSALFCNSCNANNTSEMNINISRVSNNLSSNSLRNLKVIIPVSLTVLTVLGLSINEIFNKRYNIRRLFKSDKNQKILEERTEEKNNEPVLSEEQSKTKKHNEKIIDTAFQNSKIENLDIGLFKKFIKTAKIHSACSCKGMEKLTDISLNNKKICKLEINNDVFNKNQINFILYPENNDQCYYIINNIIGTKNFNIKYYEFINSVWASNEAVVIRLNN